MAPASQSTHSYLVCVTCMSQDLAGVLKAVFCGSRWVWVGVGESHDNRLLGSLKIQQMAFLLIQTLQTFFVTRIYQVTRFLESQISKFDVASQRWPRPQVGAIQTIKTIRHDLYAYTNYTCMYTYVRDLCMHAYILGGAPSRRTCTSPLVLIGIYACIIIL